MFPALMRRGTSCLGPWYLARFVTPTAVQIIRSEAVKGGRVRLWYVAGQRALALGSALMVERTAACKVRGAGDGGPCGAAGVATRKGKRAAQLGAAACKRVFGAGRLASPARHSCHAHVASYHAACCKPSGPSGL